MDDETEVAEMLADILSLYGHEIETAESGNSALRISAKRKFDVIISDMRIPDVDGAGLYQRLKNAHPQLIDRLVFITGDALGPSSEAFLERTGLRYLEKPVTPDEVRNIVRHAMTKKGDRM